MEGLIFGILRYVRRVLIFSFNTQLTFVVQNSPQDELKPIFTQMIKQHGNVVLSPFRLFLEDSKVMYLNNGNVQTFHIWMISLRQKLSDDVVRTLSSFSEQFEPRNP